MEDVLALQEYTNPREIQLLEAFMDVMDNPWRLRNQIQIVNDRVASKKAEAKPAAHVNGVETLNGIKSITDLPSLAIVGATGYIGKNVLREAIEALHAGRIRSIRVLSSQSQRPVVLKQDSEFYTVDYNAIPSIGDALRGADILISTAGMTESGFKSCEENIITAAAATGVKIYLPSEFGTDYTQSNYRNNAIFSKKAAHASRARQLGLKTACLFHRADNGALSPAVDSSRRKHLASGRQSGRHALRVQRARHREICHRDGVAGLDSTRSCS